MDIPADVWVNKHAFTSQYSFCHLKTKNYNVMLLNNTEVWLHPRIENSTN